MHEWALAEAVIEAIIAQAREKNKRSFNYIKVVLGRLQQIDRDIFIYALNELLRLTKQEVGIDVMDIVIENEDVVAKCNRCDYRWKIDLDTLEEPVKEYIHFIPEVVHTYTSCPRCGSRDYEIIAGRGISIDIG